VADPTLYLFDGYNLLHAGGYDDARELRDALASFVALKGARGVLVFDGHGVDETRGPLEIRYAQPADTLLERLAAEHRASEEVCLVSSDLAVRGTSGLAVQKRSSKSFIDELEYLVHSEEQPARLEDRLAPDTRAALEEMRRWKPPPAAGKMRPHVAVVTLGVHDLARARRFYAEGLGWPVQQEDHNWVCFSLGGGSSALALYPWDELAEDATVPAEGGGFRGVTLAHNVRSKERVDEILVDAERAGGKIVKPAQPTSWGGYGGYFADPEGYLWEVATGATQLPFSE
jgi:catechol 2,3-dioxygenase-like lactoylglutathione lyase family enzyme/predicted RNA-binding protein with PIN domain